MTDKRTRKQELKADEIHEIISSPPNFLTKWGTTIVIMIMTGLIGASFFISYPLTIRGEIRFISVKSNFVECFLFVRKKDLPILHIGQEVVIVDDTKNEKFIGKIDSIFKSTDSPITAIFPKEQYIMDDNIIGKDARIIVGKFYLGDKILDSFMSLFTKNINEIN